PRRRPAAGPEAFDRASLIPTSGKKVARLHYHRWATRRRRWAGLSSGPKHGLFDPRARAKEFVVFSRKPRKGMTRSAKAITDYLSGPAAKDGWVIRITGRAARKKRVGQQVLRFQVELDANAPKSCLVGLSRAHSRPTAYYGSGVARYSLQ